MMLITPTAETYVAISCGSVSLANATLLTLARAAQPGRAKFAGTQPVSPDRYIDESYYRDALATLQPADPGWAASS